ncbi:MAG: hypothetical protein BZ137_03380 [Methanosphaera sp. rholeuAM130]|nr:MAG: hypothetical protein BZ137_03380 [Methanosphaera sp. rholeuAM130]
MEINRKLFEQERVKILIAFILIFLALIILVSDSVDSLITTILWPLLEGSSEGKTVIFLGMLGVFIILDVLLDKSSFINDKLYCRDNIHFKYLLATILILLACAFFGFVLELYIRHSMGVSPFTILTSMHPYPSTSSPMHSHAYKSVLGLLSYYVVPGHVNTGISILKYVEPYAYVVIPVWIVTYITGLFGFHKMTGLNKCVCIMALTLALIGLLDGGLYSQPFLIGIGLLWLMYYSNDERLKLKHFIKPVVIMGYILLVAMICEVGGSDTTSHTLTVINQTEPVDMSEYNVVECIQDGQKTTYVMNTTTPDKTLITSVFDKFKDKSDATFMSWNFYSYFDNPNTRILNSK